MTSIDAIRSAEGSSRIANGSVGLPPPTATPGADVTTLLQSLRSISANGTTRDAGGPVDGAALLAPLRSLGLATDLSASDLSLSLPGIVNGTSSVSRYAGEASSSTNTSFSILLSRLSLLLSDLAGLMEGHIKASLPALLTEASQVASLRSSVHDVQRSIEDLDMAVTRIRQPNQKGVQKLRRDQKRLHRLQHINRLVKRAARFTFLARRLEASLKVLFDNEEPAEPSAQPSQQLSTGDDYNQKAQFAQREREQALVRSARCVEAVQILLSPPEAASEPLLSSLAFVASYTPSIRQARSQILDAMEQSIVIGLRDLNPGLLSSSLLTASILGVLTDLVKDLMMDLTDVVKKRVEAAFLPSASGGADADSSGGSGSYASYKGRRQQSNAVASTSASGGLTRSQLELLNRLETLFTAEMTAVCSKIYLLQRVLGLMQKNESVVGRSQEDSVTTARTQGIGEQGGADGETLLDEATKLLGDPPTLLFWRVLSTSLSASVSTLPLGLHFSTIASQVGSAPSSYLREAIRMVDTFFEKTQVWTGIDTGKGAERVFVIRSMGLK